jgi:hypothetical protein
MSLVAWTYAGSSRTMCATCHAAEPAAAAAAVSIHAEVPCLACHERPGVIGALTYQPRLLWETVHNLTGLGSVGWADVDCSDCHAELTVDSPLLAEGHPGPEADCSVCHGNVAHPGDGLPHADDWIGLHGEEWTASEGQTCELCHSPEYCSTCHGTEIPHKANWFKVHFQSEVAKTGACSTCHTQLDCELCHIRHRVHVQQRLYEWEVER